MTITKVKGIPKRKVVIKRMPWEVTAMLDNIMRSNAKYGKLTFGEHEYAGIYSARAALKRNAENNDYPLKFTIRNAELYFIRLDI